MVKIRKVRDYLLENGFIRGRDMPHGTLYEHPDGRKTTLNEDRKRGEVSDRVLTAIKRQYCLSFDNI